jgi:Peptidase_C39 like family
MKSCKSLEVPYYSQLDNRNIPYGTCNVTSVAMCMGYYGTVGTGQGQLEDQIFDWMHFHDLDRHSPIDLVEAFTWKGIEDTFRADSRWEDVRRWISNGNPVIAHGYFTRSGHILVIRGYDDFAYGGEGAWIVNDPYGEWHRSGYDTSVSGEGLRYSYGMMAELCGDDGDLWIHFLSK